MSVILCVYFFLFSLYASSFHFYMMTRLERSSKWHKLRAGRINFMGIYILAASQHVHYFLQCVQQKWKNSAIKNLCRYLNKWLYTRLVNSLFPMLNMINSNKELQIFFSYFFDNCWFFNVNKEFKAHNILCSRHISVKNKAQKFKWNFLAFCYFIIWPFHAREKIRAMSNYLCSLNQILVPGMYLHT